MANHNLPTISSLYTEYTQSLKDRHDDALRQLDPAYTAPTNVPANAVRFSSAAGKWQRWDGTNWVDLASSYAINVSGNAATATKLATARTIGGVSFDGSANINLPGVNATGNQNTTGNAATATTAAACTGNSATATTFSTNRTNYKGVTDEAVSGQLMWKNYGNGHTIFDASNGTSPSGASISQSVAQNVWTAGYPTLMGWNGSNTYGVRVDSARVSDSCSGNAATATRATSAATADNGGVTSVNGATGAVTISSNPIPNIVRYTSSGYFIIPTGVTRIIVHLRGGGGGGGGASEAGGSYGGYDGDSGDSVVYYLGNLTPGASIYVTIGAGGAGGYSDWGGQVGFPGGNTTVSSGSQAIPTIIAAGGAGGACTGRSAGIIPIDPTGTTYDTSGRGDAYRESGRGAGGRGGINSTPSTSGGAGSVIIEY